jgi:hypothetical protein
LCFGCRQCGSGENLLQPNQQWNLDPVTGLIMSLSDGQCLTAVSS